MVRMESPHKANHSVESRGRTVSDLVQRCLPTPHPEDLL
jgi:hypothetical protein